MGNMQGMGHPDGHDYESGSPHLRHQQLRESITDSLRSRVDESLERNGRCRVLEVGAGHGDFTDALLGSGAEVVVTEMSQPSALALANRYSRNPNVTVLHDPEGDWLQRSDQSFDLTACISVLHHIPDYLGFLATAFQHTLPGGAFVSWQDPLWYARRSRLNRAADSASYFAWRATQGEVTRGLKTRWRRVRHVYDDSELSDMVEYHVVRNGVDEAAVRDLAMEEFGSVRLVKYWSTQSRLMQAVGERTNLRTTFGVLAEGRRNA